MLYCPTCRQPNEDGTPHCLQCREELVDGSFETPCPLCGKNTRIDWSFCGRCGHLLDRPEEPGDRESPRSLPELYLALQNPDPQVHEQVLRELWNVSLRALGNQPRSFWQLMEWGVLLFFEPFSDYGGQNTTGRDIFRPVLNLCAEFQGGQSAKTSFWQWGLSTAITRAQTEIDREAPVRILAAWALGQIQEGQAIPALLAALKDRVSIVRLVAAEGLGHLQAREGTSALCEALQDPALGVQRQALLALSRIADPAALPALRKKERSLRWSFVFKEDAEFQSVIRQAIEAIEQASGGTLPRPTQAPAPRPETLPRPAGESEPRIDTLPRRTEGDEV